MKIKKESYFTIFMTILLIVIIVAIIIFIPKETSNPNENDDKTQISAKETTELQKETVTNADNSANETTSNLKEETGGSLSTVEKDITLGQKNALSKAKDYLEFTAFSKSGLIDQLEYEGFTTSEINYAVDNCGADWNEQAAKKAKSYMEYTSFSRSGLLDQLEFEGFTPEQAEYGVTAVGY